MMIPDLLDPAPAYHRRVTSAGAWYGGRAWHICGFSPPGEDGQYTQYDHVWVSSSFDAGQDWNLLRGSGNDLEMPWLGRCYVRAAIFEDDIHLVGGYNDNFWGPAYNNSRVSSDHFSIGDEGRRLSRWQKPEWEAREDVGLTASDTELVMYGGVTYGPPHDDGARRVFKEIWVFPAATKKWELSPIRLPDYYRRRSSLFEHHEGWYYIAGGGNASGEAYRSCLRFKLDGTVENLPNLPEERTIAACCKAAGRLWMFFGRGYRPFPALGDDRDDYVSLDLSDPAAGWTNHGSSPVPPRYCSQPIVVPRDDGATIYFIGGATDNVSPRVFYGDVWAFNTTSATFTRQHDCTLDIDP